MLYYPTAKLFSPLNISNCVLWLDANDLTTITNVSGFCSEWRDKSGNSRNAIQATVNARPEVSTFLSFRNSLLFDGVNNFLTIPSGLFPSSFFGTEFTIGISCLFNNLSPVSHRILFVKRSAGTNGVLFGVLTNPGINTVFDWGGTSNRLTIANSTSSNISISYLLERNTANRNSLINGTNGNTGSAGMSNVDTVSNLIVGCTAPNTNMFSGYINEIIFYNKLLTSTEKEKLVGYLNWKWQGVDYLPSLHPYKTRIPKRI